MESHFVQGKEIQVDPNREYLVPSSLWDRANYPLMRAMDQIDCAPIPIVGLLQGLDNGSGGPLNQAVELYLTHCRDALEYVRSTQDTHQTQKIVEEGPVTPPNQSENIKIIEGLENTIQVLEQLQRY